MTQTERVVKMLTEARDGVCGTEFYRAHLPRYAARIYDLRRDG